MIRFENVIKGFGQRIILNDISYEVNRGEIFSIVGPSGTGKSVSLKLMIRLLTPDSGKIWIDGECISEANTLDLIRIREKFGYLFQSAALLAWMDVFENVALPLREKTALSEVEIEKKVMSALEKVGLTHAVRAFPADLSGGMQKRAGLARAIVTEPEILLYDEPTSGLDPVTSRKIDNLIADLSKNLGVTSIMVTHDMHSALSISNRIAMLHSSKLIEIATPKDFIKSKQEQIKSFLDAQYITTKGNWEKELQ